MNPQVRDIVQNYLTSYIRPHIGSGGRYAGDIPPITPEVFRSRIEGDIASFKPNSWELDSLEYATLVDQAMVLYMVAYGGWSTIPLATDATPEVVAWQKSVQGA